MPAPKDPIKHKEWTQRLSEIHKTSEACIQARKKANEACVGKQHTEEHNQKIGEAATRMWEDPEIRERQIKSRLGKKIHTEESKLAIGKANTGKTRTEESKRRTGDASRLRNTGENNPRYGVSLTEETKIKIGLKTKERLGDPDYYEKFKLAKKNQVWSEETLKRMSDEAKIRNKLEGNPNWKGGISFEPYCYKFDEPFKERVRNYFGRICTNCGKPEIENLTKKGKFWSLSVHHIHYKKQACCDEDIPKLFVALCLQCHGKTNGGREYWEDYFSNLLKERYNGRGF